MKYIGNLTITRDNCENFADLTQVAGRLEIHKGAALTAPVLTQVAGRLEIHKGATLTAPALTTTGGLEIREGAALSAPALTQVTGWLYVREGATLSAPALAYVGGLPVATPKDAAANLKIIAPLALKNGALNMREVHTCDTQHCMAGWACHAIPGGGALEQKHGWNAAGFHFLGLEAGKMFYTDTDTARKFLLQFI